MKEAREEAKKERKVKKKEGKKNNDGVSVHRTPPETRGDTKEETNRKDFASARSQQDTQHTANRSQPPLVLRKRI